MTEKATYLAAVVAALGAFAVSGGIHATERAVQIAAAQKPQVVRKHDVTIPFANSGGIDNWQPDGTKGIWIEDNHRRWYYAELMAPCLDLPYAEAVGFVTQGPDTFDKFSQILVRGQRCQVTSLVPSAGPPKKDKKPRKLAPPAVAAPAAGNSAG